MAGNDLSCRYYYMLGAIIGNMAAWTYRHDKDVFEPQLVSPEAKLSEVGLAVLAMDKIMRVLKPDVEWKKIVSTFRDVFPPQSNEVVTVALIWTEFLKGTSYIPNRVKRVALLSTDIVPGWQDDPREAAFEWGRRFHGTKEEHYTEQIAKIISRLGRRLRRGDVGRSKCIEKSMFKHHW